MDRCEQPEVSDHLPRDAWPSSPLGKSKLYKDPHALRSLRIQNWKSWNLRVQKISFRSIKTHIKGYILSNLVFHVIFRPFHHMMFRPDFNFQIELLWRNFESSRNFCCYLLPKFWLALQSTTLYLVQKYVKKLAHLEILYMLKLISKVESV